jgi:hypothetical protein
MTQIASGYLFRTDPAALVVGPTGLAFDGQHNTLYVASTGDNEIFAIPNAANRKSDAGMGNLVYQDSAHLRGPLGLVLAPNGDLITSNGDAVNSDPTQTSELVEFTPGGKFVGELSLDPNPGGAFGLAVTNVGGLLRVAAVDDNTNSLDIWTFKTDVGRPSSIAATAAGVVSALPVAVSTSASTSTVSSKREHAAAIDRVFLATRPEDVGSALSGHRHRAAAHKKHKAPMAHKPKRKTPAPRPTSPTPPYQPMPYLPGY